MDKQTQLQKTWEIHSGRFEIRTGKFGCYIYDTQLKQDVSLTKTLIRLNYQRDSEILERKINTESLQYFEGNNNIFSNSVKNSGNIKTTLLCQPKPLSVKKVKEDKISELNSQIKRDKEVLDLSREENEELREIVIEYREEEEHRDMIHAKLFQILCIILMIVVIGCLGYLIYNALELLNLFDNFDIEDSVLMVIVIIAVALMFYFVFYSIKDF